MSIPTVIGRFAPSPTGPLHFGSMLAAVASFLDARAAGGQWRLRIDDVDRTRCRPGAEAHIRATLSAFGLHWDGPVQYQDTRREVYADALEQLRRRDLAFPCGCTRREVAAAGQRGPAGMIYPGTCRAGLGPGRTARSWRFRSDRINRGDGLITFADRRLGPQQLNLAAAIGDFILRRADGLHAYPLAMVLDDAEIGVTDIVRGADLLPATAPQVALQQALGLATPRYLHLPVALDAQGRKLSKTNGAAAVDAEHPAATLHAVLTHLGQNPPAALTRATPREILDWAIAHWRPAALPHTDSLTASPLPGHL